MAWQIEAEFLKNKAFQNWLKKPHTYQPPFALVSNGYVPDSIVIGDLALEIARRVWTLTDELTTKARTLDTWSNDWEQGRWTERVKEIVREELQRRFA